MRKNPPLSKFIPITRKYPFGSDTAGLSWLGLGADDSTDSTRTGLKGIDITLYNNYKSGSKDWIRFNRARFEIPFGKVYSNGLLTKNLERLSEHINGIVNIQKRTSAVVYDKKFASAVFDITGFNDDELLPSGRTNFATSLYARDYLDNKTVSSNNTYKAINYLQGSPFLQEKTESTNTAQTWTVSYYSGSEGFGFFNIGWGSGKYGLSKMQFHDSYSCSGPYSVAYQINNKMLYNHSGVYTPGFLNYLADGKFSKYSFNNTQYDLGEDYHVAYPAVGSAFDFFNPFFHTE